MQVAIAVGLFIAGGGAYYYRWLWGVVACIALGVAVWQWSGDVYSDSGNEIGFSLLVVTVVLAPALAGALAGSTARAAAARHHRTDNPERGTL